MLRKILYLVIAVICQLLTVNFLSASDKVGTTAAQFLKMPIGARPLGMGEAFVGLADDVNAIYWNPAGMTQIKGRELTAMHTIWFEDIFFSNLAYAQEGLGGVIGGAVNYLSAGKIEMADKDGFQLDETYSPSDIVAILSYARIVKGISAGGNLKFISSKIEEENATAFAVDIGGLYKGLKVAGRNLPIGLVIQNIGTKMKFVDEADPLPLTVRIGGSYNILRRTNSNTTLVMDINVPFDNSVNVHIGGEYVHKFKQVKFSGRLGYKTTTIKDLNALSGLTVGLGFNWRYYALDYVWVSYGDLGNTHRISVNFKLPAFSSSKPPLFKEKK